MTGKTSTFNRRQARNRFKLKSSAKGTARLCVFRSGRHIYAQIIHDVDGKTLAAASSVEADVIAQVKKGTGKTAATAVGKILADRAVKAGVKKVVFDRGGYIYHGRIKALADAAREAGLSF
ncbi:MAG: 50S ribosomal protein L18 [Alphaproteobacteria bacterium]|jgi:large subunit ribosomal protein L18|nr:50S ribosomal protein L18 [Alphaproteobacteria bacterium]PHX99052.1 MAG: 50S ribosomal protein L18 [Rhodospirillaceae bacterium]